MVVLGYDLQAAYRRNLPSGTVDDGSADVGSIGLSEGRAAALDLGAGSRLPLFLLCVGGVLLTLGHVISKKPTRTSAESKQKTGPAKRNIPVAKKVLDDDQSTECTEASTERNARLRWVSECCSGSEFSEAEGSIGSSVVATESQKGHTSKCTDVEEAIQKAKAIISKFPREGTANLTNQLVNEFTNSRAVVHEPQYIEAVAAELVVVAVTNHGAVEVCTDACVAIHKSLKGSFEGAEVVFKRFLIGKCTKLLEQYLFPPPVSEELSSQEKLEELVKHRTVMFGNAMLIGELVLRQLLPTTLVIHFSEKLLLGRSEAALETLCVMMTAVSTKLETPVWKGYRELDNIFAKLQKIAASGGCSPMIACCLKELRGRRTKPRSPSKGSSKGEQQPSWRKIAEQHLQGQGCAKPVAADVSHEPKEPASSVPLSVRRLQEAQQVVVPPPRVPRGAPKILQCGGGKKTCRIYVGIEPDDDFQVCRRLIGRGGCNMKEIVSAAKDVKIRIRGRGSGFLEGAEKQEVDEPLMICISSPTDRSFNIARAKVEELLQKVDHDYDGFCKQRLVWRAQCLASPFVQSGVA